MGEVTLLETGETFEFTQKDDLLIVDGLPEERDTTMPVVLCFATEDTPRLYLAGGARAPKVPHCRYDPVDPDVLW